MPDIDPGTGTCVSQERLTQAVGTIMCHLDEAGVDEVTVQVVPIQAAEVIMRYLTEVGADKATTRVDGSHTFLYTEENKCLKPA